MSTKGRIVFISFVENTILVPQQKQWITSLVPLMEMEVALKDAQKYPMSRKMQFGKSMTTQNEVERK